MRRVEKDREGLWIARRRDGSVIFDETWRWNSRSAARDVVREADWLEDEKLGQLQVKVDALRRCIDHAMAEVDFAEDDEKCDSANATTRRVRFANIRDCLNGVGDLAARAALQEPKP